MLKKIEAFDYFRRLDILYENDSCLDFWKLHRTFEDKELCNLYNNKVSCDGLSFFVEDSNRENLIRDFLQFFGIDRDLAILKMKDLKTNKIFEYIMSDLSDEDVFIFVKYFGFRNQDIEKDKNFYRTLMVVSSNILEFYANSTDRKFRKIRNNSLTSFEKLINKMSFLSEREICILYLYMVSRLSEYQIADLHGEWYASNISRLLKSVFEKLEKDFDIYEKEVINSKLITSLYLKNIGIDLYKIHFLTTENLNTIESLFI